MLRKLLLVPAVLAVLLAYLLVPGTAGAADCRFVLGFATLKALIDAAEGPEVVGECLENERTNPLNGDALQHTTGGLMVWRKHDNFTAFTDGYRTWIHGPFGLQKRLNSERFDWEPEPPPVPTVEPGPAATAEPTPVETPVVAPTATPAAVAEVPRYVAQDSVAGDRAALVALYHATGGPNWTLKKNWLTNAPLGEWYGVRTNKRGRVSHLALVNNELAGTIPRHLGNISNLVMLNLGGNALTGGIPVELGNLSNLESLDLEGNGLTGNFPAALGRIPDLQRLILYGTRLSGCLPHALSRLRYIRSDLSLCRGGSAAAQDNAALVARDRAALVALYRATGGRNWYSNHNWLSDAPLQQWYGVSTNRAGRVIMLTLSRNKLKGRLPAALGNLTALQALYAVENELSGQIPAELGKLTQLSALSLGDNRLNGSIPAELGRLRNLTILNLGVNRLSGSIPAALGNLVNLERLVLEYNSLRGGIPRELGALHRLQKLKLEGNNLTGAIPGELGRLTRLEWLMLAGNRLTGGVPNTLGNLTYLTRLELGGSNRITGCLPVVAPHTDAPGLSPCGGAVQASVGLLATQLPPPPTSLRLDGVYRKYVDARGVPIIAPIGVADEALLRARDVLGEMLAGRPQLYADLVRKRTRVVIGGRTGAVSDLPEFRNWGRYEFEGGRIGGIYEDERIVDPRGGVTVAFEDNVLCYPEDGGALKDVLVHELAHAIEFALPASFRQRVDTAYRNAMRSGLWQGAYAASNAREYWAEAVGAWFALGGSKRLGVTTRASLRRYDPGVARLVEEVFGNAEVRASCHTGVSVQGKVVGSDGRPLRGVRLEAVNFLVYHFGPNRYASIEAETDVSGNFHLSLPKGHYWIEIARSDGALLGYYGEGGFASGINRVIPLEVSGGRRTGIRIVVP